MISHRAGRLHLFADGNRWPIHRPRLFWWWASPTCLGVDLSWSDGSSDPVWLVGFEIDLSLVDWSGQLTADHR